MRLRAPLAITAAALILGVQAAAADPTGQYFYVSPAIGYTVFHGSIRFPDAPLEDGLYYGARTGYQWRPWLGFEAAGGAAPTREHAPGGSDVGFWHASGNAVFSTWGGLLGNPFVSVGFGMSRLSPSDKSAQLNIADSPPGDVNQGNLEAAAGFNYWATDRWGIRIEGRDLAWMPKGGDGSHPLTHTITFAAAFTYTFGSKPRDTDLDAVPDRADQCPATPKGATVDATGCTHDSDGDGVLDGLDQCPGTTHGCAVDARGCPTDADGDGVCDGVDKCADTPHGATVDSSGCSHDSDGDGVLDGIDQCPNTPKGAHVDDKGCPVDSDHDGVPDGIDQCPGTEPGVAVDSTGCPAGYRERQQEFLDTGMIRLENVQFETGKANLKPAALPILDAMGDLLTKWPALKIEIGGHTDAKGSAKTNAKLSQARADTVRAYVLRRFPSLDPSQYVAKGYGSSRPIASNDTEAGRTLNRRVEFVVLNRGVLIQEIEKRSHPAAPDSSSTLPKPAPAPADTTRTPGK